MKSFYKSPLLYQPLFLGVMCGLLLIQHIYHSIIVIAEKDDADVQARHVNVSEADQAAIIKKIIDANLFKSAASPEKSSSSMLMPKSSALASFQLKGTFAGSGNAPSYAIIISSDQKEKLYRVGDALGNGITIESIDADHVVIRDNELNRTIYLREPK